jgi:hypothetical protein
VTKVIIPAVKMIVPANNALHQPIRRWGTDGPHRSIAMTAARREEPVLAVPLPGSFARRGSPEGVGG